MLIKHVKDIDIQDEFIKVKKTDKVLEIAKMLVDVRKERLSEAESDELIRIPILAAYVIEKGKPIGVIYEENIMEAVILEGKDPKTLKAGDVMVPPTCFNLNDEIRDVVNTIIDKGLLTVAVCDGDEFVSVVSVFDAIFLKEGIDD